ncbi:type-F conjugative transfer system secretin TraK [Rickettsia endosymbiont of Ixodes pacificus]|nr:type-F conjugative transfer system secretin TraK [Rickettsia endosymbiont of Ixodes pacificus]
MLHDDSILELQIAKNSPTRITIEGDKINDIIIHP